MNSESELLQKLMISKKIMEKHNEIGRGQARDINMENSAPMVESYEAPQAKYNLPQEFMQEQQITRQTNSNVPMEDRIANSKLPDEIKRLMIEHPIQQPTMGMSTGAVLSDDLVEKASRLMNSNSKVDQISESKSVRQTQKTQSLGINSDEIKKIIRETVEEILHENGLLIESETKSNEMFKFRVGQHIFEGKVNKIRKVAK
jgi:hypothetical protein